VTEAPASPLEQQARAWAEERVAAMAELREFAVPAPDADGHDVHDAVRELRGKLDLAETILQDASRRLRKARREARRLGAVADDAFDDEMDALAKKAVRLEYQSVHDRLAMARVASSPKRRSAREAERVADIVEEAVDHIKSAYFALRDIRRELLATLEHYLPWEASLER
jgi:hypothetical protein